MVDLRRVTALASVQLAPNPGPMTLDGTNSYLLRGASSASCVVVDPGPDNVGHLQALAAGPVDLILITHQHIDHTEGADRLHALTGAPVRAALPAYCFGGAELNDGERIEAAGVQIDVVATPGHSGDSVSFYLPEDRPLAGEAPTSGSVLTGDTVLGRGSTVIGVPDGTLAQYLESLRTIAELGAPHLTSLIGLPAHGPVLGDLAAVCERYLAHRLQRLEQVRQALVALGMSADEARSDDGMAAVLTVVHPDIDPAIVFAAVFSIAAQLAYLASAQAT
ncbi:MAG: MBL fold metallo-hydrolase [Nakamurella sp.]